MESGINLYFNNSLSYNSTFKPLIPYNDSGFTTCLNIFNPNSIIYTNALSNFGVSIGFLKFLVYGLCITSMGIFGVIGNTLAIFVLSRSPQMSNSSTSYYLRCLAISDTIGIISCMVVLGVPTLLVFNSNSESHNMTTWLMYNKGIIQFSRIVPSSTIIHIGIIGMKSEN